ncbi:hypothetical protein IJT93_10715 [bacterium]|nr:hypothetical protein [bacterium]
MSLRIPKERKEVIIYTNHHRIEGEIYLVADSKVADELNVRAKEFISVTNANVFSVNGDTLLYTSDFVTVNKHAIEVMLSTDNSKLD